jgi:hypothetical protein
MPSSLPRLRGARRGTHELDPRLEIARLAVPRQRFDPELPHAGEHRLARSVGGDLGERLLLESERVELERAVRDHRLLARAPVHRLAPAHAIGEMLRQIAPLERCGQQDARIALAIVEVHRHDQLAPRQRLGRAERRAAPVGEREAAVTTGTGAADAVGVGKREQQPRSSDSGAHRAFIGLRGVLRLGLPLQVAGCTPRTLERRAVGHRRPALGAQNLEPCADIRVGRRRAAAQQIALREQRRELRGERQLPQRAGAQ